ncbi:hypothetical protein ACFO0F_32605, partial [Nonomuraea zeae]
RPPDLTRPDQPHPTITGRGPLPPARLRWVDFPVSRCLLCGRESITAKYELIDAEKADYKIIDMCRWLQVSRSGFYEWRSRPMSATAERRERLKVLIAVVFDDSHETYGYRRVHAAVAAPG